MNAKLASAVSEFACRSAACAPPPAGTGGSLPGGGRRAPRGAGTFDDQLDTGLGLDPGTSIRGRISGLPPLRKGPAKSADDDYATRAKLLREEGRKATPAQTAGLSGTLAVMRARRKAADEAKVARAAKKRKASPGGGLKPPFDQPFSAKGVVTRSAHIARLAS